MTFATSAPVTRGVGSVARQLTAVILAGVIVTLFVASALVVGSFIWNDVPRIVGGAFSVLSQGSYGPGW